MRYSTRLLYTGSPPGASRSGSPGLAVWRVLFSVWLIAACALSLPRTSQAQTFLLLHRFNGADGTNPYGALVQATDGNLYGTTSGGYAGGNSTVFRITTAGALTTLHVFNPSNGTDGGDPFGGLIQTKDGNLYGTTSEGGASGTGTIFKITTAGALTILHNFSALSSEGTNSDGASPFAGLIQATDGNFYGTTSAGGANGKGTVFKITTAGALTTLYSFNPANGIDGAVPWAGLIQARDRNLYGATSEGGANGTGTVFKITTAGALTTLHTFGPLSNSAKGIVNFDGGVPFGGLIQARDGNLYGTTELGGPSTSGTAFKMTTKGVLTTLHNFGPDPLGGNSGFGPRASLIQATDGNLYGTTGAGGANGVGTIFRITTKGVLTTLHNFSSIEGAAGWASLIQATDGYLYGTAFYGGDSSGQGTIFSVATAPVLTSLSPSSVDTARGAFTLTLTGKSFGSSSVVQWAQGSATTPLTVTFASNTQLKAVVPASLLSTPGTAALTVVNVDGSVSNSKPFTILLTNFRLLVTALTKSGAGAYTANVTLQNVGNLSAPSVMITRASLGTAATNTMLPVSLGSIAKGKAVSTSLSFPISAGASDTVVTLKVTGTFTGGVFMANPKVTLP